MKESQIEKGLDLNIQLCGFSLKRLSLLSEYGSFNVYGVHVMYNGLREYSPEDWDYAHMAEPQADQIPNIACVLH